MPASPVTVDTIGTRPGSKSKPATTAANSSSIGRINGEWNACETDNRRVITRAALIAGLDATRISFPPALDAVKDSVGRAFPPHDLACALAFFLADIPDWIIRHRPGRTAPVKTVRPSLRYTTRSTTDPGTRLVTRTIELHLLKPQKA